MKPITQTQVPSQNESTSSKRELILLFIDRYQLKTPITIASITLIISIFVFGISLYCPVFHYPAIALLSFSALEVVIIYQIRYKNLSRFVVCTIVDLILCYIIVLCVSSALPAIFTQYGGLQKLFISFRLWYASFKDAYPFVLKVKNYLGLLPFVGKIWYDLQHKTCGGIENWKLHVGTLDNTVIMIVWIFVVVYMLQLHKYYFELISTGAIIITSCICICSCIKKSNISSRELNRRLTYYLLGLTGLSWSYTKFSKRNRFDYESFIPKLKLVLSYRKSQLRNQHKLLIQTLISEIEKLEETRGFQRQEKDMINCLMLVIGLCWSYTEIQGKRIDQYINEIEHVWEDCQSTTNKDEHKINLIYGIAYGEILMGHAMHNAKSTADHVNTNIMKQGSQQDKLPNRGLYRELRSRLPGDIQLDFMNWERKTHDSISEVAIREILKTFELE